GLEEDARRAIVGEAAGSPFLITALARHPGASTHLRGSLRFGDVVADRLTHIPGDARAGLEGISAAGGPLDRATALAATGAGEAGQPAIFALEEACLLRSTRQGGLVALDVYHDRIRQTLLEQLDLGALRALHGRIADTMKALGSAEPEALFHHYSQAGDDRAA